MDRKYITVNAGNSSVGFVFRAGIGYRHEFSDFLGIAAGLGLNGYYQSETQTYSGQSVTASRFDLSIYGRLTADFTLFDSLRINAGLAMGGPVYVLISASAAGQSESRS